MTAEKKHRSLLTSRATTRAALVPVQNGGRFSCSLSFIEPFTLEYIYRGTGIMVDELPNKLGTMVSVRRARMKGIDQLGPWVIAAIAIAFLYFGRTALVPLTLAVLLSFLLAPIVAGLRKLRLGRQLSVIFAVLLALGTITVTSAVIVSQAGRLAKDAPAYAETIAAKATALRSGFHQRLGFLLTETGRASGGPTRAEFAQKVGEKRRVSALTARAIPVEIREPPVTAMQEIEGFVLPALGPIETGLIVLVVAIFILFQKEDLRDRLIRLMGTADIHRTTVALDDGAKRLSRYFLSQFVVNCGFGAFIWGGLFLIGIPSPGLWGILAGLLRFVPYVGVFVAMLGPIALAAAVDPGWSMVIYVALLFVIVEPIVGYVIEPLLYGHSTGLSPVSVVVAALFWTLLWGPVGLVLAMPLTLMLVVLGRHIPAFYVFDVLLGDRPALSSAETFYQRALAGHPELAIEQAESMLETQSLLAYYDEVVLGALRLVAADVDRGAIDRPAVEGVGEVVMEVLSALDEFSTAREADIGSGTMARHLVCVSGRGPLDHLVAAIVAQLARKEGFTVTEHARDDWGSGTSSQAEPGATTKVCLLGLFGDNSKRRIAPILTSLRQRFPDHHTAVGVSRTIDPTSEGMHATFTSLCTAIGLEENASMSA